MLHPDIRTCSKGKIFFSILLRESERGGFDWTTHDTLSVPHACNVSCDISRGLMRHPDIRTCSDGNFFVSILLGNSEEGLIGRHTTPCPCHMRAMSAVTYLEA